MEGTSVNTAFADFVALCRELERTPGRLEKRRLTADFLRRLDTSEVATAVAFLSGRAFPVSDPRVLGVRGLPNPPADHRSDRAPQDRGLTIADVAATFAAVAEATGAGSRRAREERLLALAARATVDERAIVHRIIGGEMRTGVSEGVVLEAIAALAGGDLPATRRAALFLGDLSVVAELAATGGAAGLAAVTPRPFVALLPMLAEIATDFGDVLAAHGGRTALEYKYDGARIQLHKDGDRVRIWSRRMSDVTRSLPDVVELARRDLPRGPVILDGEVLALDRAGRPLAFQELMRRFRRVHGVESLVGEMPLALYFFDCLMSEGRALIDAPYAERWDALTTATGGRYLARRVLVGDVATAQQVMADALAEGHEGVMAKDLKSAYEPGGRGKRWFKVKSAATVDCVIVAADRGSGRRAGWLSNYHLAVRAGDEFAAVGKTFKGLTDAEFGAMTERLQALAVGDDGYTVRVRPEVVVEVEYNEIQKSPTYPSGLALRFARIARIRDDKAPGQATTLDELRALYERQFGTKGRVV
ncbi:MAG: ATP-dependent DNA ligase [Candidatus Rokubacteria bacterium]|nr:ATP-dependent DNA ligase [Candidatus Rokubacteria bacterium]